jgi:hypothetical protein
MDLKNLTSTVILMLLFFLYPPFVVYARISLTYENANIVRDAQLLLSLKGFYTGPLDGLCKTQTQQAIEKYKGLPTTTPPRLIALSQVALYVVCGPD